MQFILAFRYLEEVKYFNNILGMGNTKYAYSF